MPNNNNQVSNKPHRCVGCNRLLFKGEIGTDGVVNVKCGRCGTMNEFTPNLDEPKNFQDRVYLNKVNNDHIKIVDKKS